MIPWDYNKIDEYYYPSEEYRYIKTEIDKYISEVIVTKYLTDMNDINYLYGDFYSD